MATGGAPSLPLLTDGSQPKGRVAAFVNYTYTDLSRNLFTPAPYLRSFSADTAYYLFQIRTQDQNIIPTQKPRPNGMRQSQYLERRCPPCPGRSLGSEAHLYLSCPCVSTLADPLIGELLAGLPWDGYTIHQQMAVLLGTMPHGLRVKHHKQLILTILPQCHALAARLTLTVQKEIQVAAARAGMTADHLRAVFSVPPVTAGGTPIRVPSPEVMGSSDEE